MELMTIADARALLIDRIGAFSPNWTPDQPLPNHAMDDGSLAYPLHQWLAHADPGLRVRRPPDTWDVFFDVPRLGEHWEANIDTALSGPWGVRLHDRTASGYAYRGLAHTLAELDDAMAEVADTIARLAATHPTDRAAATA